MTKGPAISRAEMVRTQLRDRGIADERVLTAMGTVPREAFLDEGLRHLAYADGALPIGHDQTVSQPWVVAAICEALELRGGEIVLEVGTGSGYSAAVLSRLARRVIGVELVPELAQAAKWRLRALRASNVEVIEGDGSLGAPDRAPFDAIAVHAAAPAVPAALVEQLVVGGRLVIPLAQGDADVLTAIVREPGESADGTLAHRSREIAPCRFVPLLGDAGFGS